MDSIEKLSKIIWVCLCATFGLMIIGFLSKLMLNESKIDIYTLSSSCYNMDGSTTPAIMVNVNNGPDYEVKLGKDITFQQAVHICDSLNAQLKKYQSK